MTDIKEIYQKLHWENTEQKKQEGMRLARQVEDLSLLLMPPAPAYVWICCAQVLSEKTDSVLEPYLYGLLEWLYDLNWPGALKVLERLKNFSGEKLKQPFVDCCTRALQQNNDEGLKWLVGLAELLDNQRLKAQLSKEWIATLQHKAEDCLKTDDGSVP